MTYHRIKSGESTWLCSSGIEAVGPLADLDIDGALVAGRIETCKEKWIDIIDNISVASKKDGPVDESILTK